MLIWMGSLRCVFIGGGDTWVNTLACFQFTQGQAGNHWYIFSLDRQTVVQASWGKHPAESFLVWSNVSNYSARVNLVPLTKQRWRQREEMSAGA